jgi:hypothetical protein
LLIRFAGVGRRKPWSGIAGTKQAPTPHGRGSVTRRRWAGQELELPRTRPKGLSTLGEMLVAKNTLPETARILQRRCFLLNLNGPDSRLGVAASAIPPAPAPRPPTGSPIPAVSSGSETAPGGITKRSRCCVPPWTILGLVPRTSSSAIDLEKVLIGEVAYRLRS